MLVLLNRKTLYDTQIRIEAPASLNGKLTDITRNASTGEHRETKDNGAALEGGGDTRLSWTRRLKLMRDAEMVHPPAQGQVVSRTRLALKLYKGAQSVSSYTERVSKQPWPRLAQPTCGRGAAVWLWGTLTQSPTCSGIHHHAVGRDPINFRGGKSKSCILLSNENLA